MGKYSQGNASAPHNSAKLSTVNFIRITHPPLWLEEIHALRYQVLRLPLGGSPESAEFAGDDSPTTLHFSSWKEDDLVGCASLFSANCAALAKQFASTSQQFQLRGMAVADSCRGLGVGGILLSTIHQWADSYDVHLWCNAREAAVPFYEKYGWITYGNLFDISGVGPHRIMLRVPPRTSAY